MLHKVLSMAGDNDQLDSLEALNHLEREGSITGALDVIKKRKPGRPRKNTLEHDRFELPPAEKFKKMLKRIGLSEIYVARKIKDMMDANKVTIDRKGDIHEAPDHSIRMKAIELYLSYYVPKEDPKSDSNHLHLHGEKQIDDLLNKARRT